LYVMMVLCDGGGPSHQVDDRKAVIMGRAALGAHPAAQDERVAPGLAQQVGELSRWLVRLVRTRQLRSLLSAARTSAMTCRVR
jgi:hypothetical protein